MSTKRQPRTEANDAAPAPAPAAQVDPVDPEWTVLEDSEPIPHGGQMMTLLKGQVLGERRYGAALIDRWRRVYGLKLQKTAG